MTTKTSRPDRPTASEGSHNPQEFWYELLPCEYGVGVFTRVPISRGTKLHIFHEYGQHLRPESEVPEEFGKYCIRRGSFWIAPKDFLRMDMGFRGNHDPEANVFHQGPKFLDDENWDPNFYAAWDLEPGEELRYNYRNLGMFFPDGTEDVKPYYDDPRTMPPTWYLEHAERDGINISRSAVLPHPPPTPGPSPHSVVWGGSVLRLRACDLFPSQTSHNLLN